ncbi:MAG: hypothetical protein QJR09_12610 [Micrococcus sp.]|nr:hypothetical protein [Micrococcus sp.]
MTAEQQEAAPDGESPGEGYPGPDDYGPGADEYGPDECGPEEDCTDEEGADEGVKESRKILVLLIILVAASALFALFFLALDLPQCEDPAIDWIPCIGP